MSDPMDHKINQEAVALWAEVFGSTPPASADSGSLFQALLESLPPLGYDRFTRPELGDGGLVWPVRQCDS